MGRMAFETGADCGGAMQEITSGVPLMAMGAEDVRRNHETGIGILVMTVVATLFGKGGVCGILLGTLLLFQLGRLIILRGLNVILPAVLLRRRHSRHPVENGAGDLMHSQGVTRAD